MDGTVMRTFRAVLHIQGEAGESRKAKKAKLRPGRLKKKETGSWRKRKKKKKGDESHRLCASAL